MKEVLIVIDMQKDFLTGALANAKEKTVTANVRSKIEKWRKEGKEIVFTRDTHGENYLQTQEGERLPVPHCIKNTDGWQIIDGLNDSTDKVFDKPTFGSVDLPSVIKAYGEAIEEIALCGLCTDICVISNAMILKATFPDVRITVYENCCAGVTKESHATALDAMRAVQIEVK